MNSLLYILSITVLSGLISPFHLSAQTHDAVITIHLRGVFESKISLLSLSGNKPGKPVAELPAIRNGETAKLQVSKENLPGEFVLC